MKSTAQLDRIFLGDGEYVRADKAIKAVHDLQAERVALLGALKEAAYFILAPAEDLKESVLYRVRTAIAMAEGRS